MASVTGTGTVTLERITLDGAGVIVDTSESPVSSFTADSNVAVILEIATTDGGTASFAGTNLDPFDHDAVFSDAVSFSSVFGSIEETTELTSAATFRSVITDSRIVALDSTLEFTDVVTDFITTDVVPNAFAVSDTLTVVSVTSPTIEAGFTLGDDLVVGLVDTISSAFEMSDSQVLSATATETLTISFTITGSEVELASTNIETVSNTFTLSDTQDMSGSVYCTNIDSSAVFGSAIIALNFDAVAWTLNTESGGISNYQNYDFRSLAASNGVLYGTNSFGVYKLEGDTDDGRAIGAMYQTGFLDFGIDYKKRISDIYVGYTSDGTMECDVETQTDLYTYEMPEHLADAPLNNRIKPGKGLLSRYWRFTVRNVDGADFQIYDLAAEVATSKTRRL